MQIYNIAQCKRSLDFKPLKMLATALPAYSWYEYLLNGFERHEGPVIDLASDTSASFLEAFTICHPQMTLAELARVWQKLQTLQDERIRVDWHAFFAFYQIRYSDNLLHLLERLVILPENFQQWTSQRMVSAGDLAILRSFAASDLMKLAPILEKIVQLNVTRSQGTKLLELFGELKLLGKEIALGVGTADTLMRELEHLRQPMTFERDQSAAQTLATLPWPSETHARWLRHGDQAGIEVKFWASSPADFSRKLKGLGHVDELSKKLWGEIDTSPEREL